jgi:plasmid stabilization system protein ParE
MFTVIFHPAAKQDFLEAYLWYEERSPGLGDRFSRVIEGQIRSISQNPEHYPIKRSQYRESKTDIFPYLIVYKVYHDTGIIYIISVYHTSRKPGKKYRK